MKDEYDRWLSPRPTGPERPVSGYEHIKDIAERLLRKKNDKTV
jgi:hypothetical protein